MGRQKTDWGEILWLEEEKELFSLEGLKVGIVTLFPGAHQPRHIHYEEQVIYIIQGQAVSKLDGVESSLSPGGFFHWKVGVEHEINNIGNVPFQHLLISNPAAEESGQLFSEQTEKKENLKEVSPDLIYIAVEAIRTQFLETLHYGYAIFDSLGNLLLQSQSFPEYCMDCCNPNMNQGGCFCMHQLLPKDWGQEQVFRCRNGMEIFHYPIYFRSILLGFIQSGYIRHSNNEKGRIENVYDVPESVVAGIKALLGRIVKAIRNFCEFEQFRRELVEKELCIASHEETQRILVKNLRDVQYAMTDLKINNHFLFNTLNSMASMALGGGQMKLYQSIVDLSKMFHYTLRTQNSVVPLKKEMDYVKAYLQLQKLRYGEDLETTYQIDKSVLKASVPFNFLQPIVENAFAHGFSECTHKKIEMSIQRTGGRIGIEIKNSGKTLTEQEVYRINQGILGNTSHGLSMIYHKLCAVYGKDCKFLMGIEQDKTTCFQIQIPIFPDAECGKEPV